MVENSNVMYLFLYTVAVVYYVIKVTRSLSREYICLVDKFHLRRNETTCVCLPLFSEQATGVFPHPHLRVPLPFRAQLCRGQEEGPVPGPPV